MNLDPSAFLADPELILALDRHSIEITCGSEQVLFRQGDAPVGLYILHKGHVFLSHTTPGTFEFSSIQVLPGSMLGLPGLVGNRPYTLTAIAEAGAQLSFIARAQFDTILQRDSLLAIKVTQVLAAEVRTARQTVVELPPASHGLA
jgi:CRP-like cAMP-binding protein